MKPPVIQRTQHNSASRCGERGVTMVLVAVAMIAIIGMAALSIDVITLYLAREEAQRSADAAALAAARVISMSGMTGDPTNSSLSWQAICGGLSSPASKAAIAVGMQSAVGGTVANTPTVTYSAPGVAPDSDCSTLTPGGAFSVNPLVTVKVTRASLPTFFSRIWGNTGNSVSATATAEAFNPSASDAAGSSGVVTAVQPRCVKPWVVPNLDPLWPSPTGGYCSQTGGPVTCNPLVSTANGAIFHGGISLGGTGTTGVIGETFWLTPDCAANPSRCNLGVVPPKANAVAAGPFSPAPAPNLVYVPGQVGNPVFAIPSCSQGDPSDPYQQAVEGCDSPTNYHCGEPGQNMVDLSRNPSDATTAGVQCLIHQTDSGVVTASSGQDYLKNDGTATGFGKPNSYPFEILAGSNNSLGLTVNPISSSNSIVSLPIYNQTLTAVANGTTTPVTFIGFLQVFVNAVDANGNVNVTVLNVAGCGDGPVNSNSVTGTSPVPIRLITPP